jgi:hypothetical protein
MRSRTVQVLLTVGGVAVILTGTLIASTYGGSAPTRHGIPAVGELWSGKDYKAVIELPDDRKVEVRFVKRKGLGERHYDPTTKKWSETNLIYKTKSDPARASGCRPPAALSP